jgi:hypothetical protein
MYVYWRNVTIQGKVEAIFSKNFPDAVDADSLLVMHNYYHNTDNICKSQILPLIDHSYSGNRTDLSSRWIITITVIDSPRTEYKTP